jgi:hypothetical protein
MTLSGDFYYHGFVRWNLGWPTPNYAGAFITTLLALAFAFSWSRWRWAGLAVEAGGMFLLAKTYSRGAVVAWIAACVFAVVAGRAWRERGEIVIWVMRVVVFGVMLGVVGFGFSRAGSGGGAAVNESEEQRLNMSGMPVPRSGGALASDGPKAEKSPAEDGSVVNRLALWRGGAAMIAAAPFSGWGAGEAGSVYMNWFQDLDRTEGFSTMVNSFLHVGVEYGVGLLMAVVAGLGMLLALAWKVGREEGGSLQNRTLEMHLRQSFGAHAMCATSGAVLVAWAVANVFTTMWIDWKLWIVPCVAAGLIVWQVRRGTATLPGGLVLRQAAGFGIATAMVGTLVLLIAGHIFAARSPYRVEPAADGAISARSRAESAGDKITWHLWPDPTMLGPTPGKELRRWLGTVSAGNQWVVHRARAEAPWAELGDATGVILIGRQAERLATGGALGDRPLRVIHPLGAPPGVAVRAARSTELIFARHRRSGQRTGLARMGCGNWGAS